MAVNLELLLFIEPENKPSDKPVIDELTKKMASSFRKSKKGTIKEYSIIGQGYKFIENNGYMGWHECSCGAQSGAYCSLLPNGEMTNDNCVHYLAYHRDEVPQEQLDRVAKLDDGQVIPNVEELERGRPKNTESGNKILLHKEFKERKTDRVDVVKNNMKKMGLHLTKDDSRTQARLKNEEGLKVRREEVRKMIEEAGGIASFVDKMIKEDRKIGDKDAPKWEFNEDIFMDREKFKELSEEVKKGLIIDNYLKYIEERDGEVFSKTTLKKGKYKVGGDIEEVFKERKEKRSKNIEVLMKRGFYMDDNPLGEVGDITNDILKAQKEDDKEK